MMCDVSQKGRKMKNKILVRLFTIAMSVSAVGALTTLNVDASVVSNDLHPELGKPAMVVSEITPVGSVNTKILQKLQSVQERTVVRLQANNTLSVNGHQIRVNEDDFITGAKLDKYAAEHPKQFAKKIKTTKQTYLYDPKTYKKIAQVRPDTQFISAESYAEDKDFFIVMFDDRKALLYKQDATMEIYVQVTSLDDTKESLQEIWENMQELAEDLNLSDIHFEYSTEAGNTVVDFAKQYVGNPYVWGGTSLTDGCDCSGFVQQVYAHYGITLPRCSNNQSKVGERVSASSLQPGDLLFFQRGATIGHVAMYAGNGMIVHAKGSKYGIVYESLRETPKVCRRYIKNLED